jgi:hypothetical protein
VTQQETELVWLTKKVKTSESLIERAQAYFDEHRFRWPREIEAEFFFRLERMKDQLYFEQSQLEKLAWQIHEERERLAGREEVSPRTLM